MVTPSIVPLVATAVTATQLAMRANRRHIQREWGREPAPGSPDADLSEIEKCCLHAVLEHFTSQKRAAQFRALCPTDHQTSKYGVWAWQNNGREITLTAMPHASMVEITRDRAIEAGFIWNNLLKEWNDVTLPIGFGRGQCKCSVGVTVYKSDSALHKQRRRIRIMTARRAIRQWWAAAKRTFQRAR